MFHAGTMLVAMATDVALGWPDRLHARIGHPVVWIGRIISALDERWNRGSAAERRRAGVAALLVTVLAAALPAALLQSLLPGGLLGAVLTGLLAWPLVALRSMHEHVEAVAVPLDAGDLPGARRAVSMIVGRDPSQLDGTGVARAALESLAENSSDGIVAPLFWGVLLGLPGIAAYKAINTLDSMIGHRTPRHEAFGWASARTDDWVNLIPARLTGVLFAFASGRPRRALAVMRRDARAHRSPNAGWPEAAMAGALGVRLSGPRIYGDRVSAEPWLNAGAPDPGPADLRQGLALYRRGMVLLAALFLLVAVA
ncbi:adenosylcobinamide-phosphate synthase CbiB [Cereibacter sphaeroides]|uniref:Cobalamin biosynthesis protein CobD n=2 Tax=Cereibacter sphaeroides TaxID=1063 RepID=Q3J0S7_CERS4|nr:adenosylcobinamide-phosphate synthase CbiB [Cereibacter sphaeroides]ABA79607.1 adenosylcobinamide-phosphate synthase [Cereibacter sphaeroides 2.4.1]AXC61819.1 cobalamin biosynthesis protein CobD [Cereibacter sphaeroides 2.4.1]QHA13803.1 cobalamin biosynthesis protein CobD [Cereibacter sphaeroides]QJC83238.1 cobalamin biosynthesis protein CobD [Cereibacter sphaeroides]GEM91360.1 cobalamin biosynthesis protein CobD [Cereibacter sphaeroides]